VTYKSLTDLIVIGPTKFSILYMPVVMSPIKRKLMVGMQKMTRHSHTLQLTLQRVFKLNLDALAPPLTSSQSSKSFMVHLVSCPSSWSSEPCSSSPWTLSSPLTPQLDVDILITFLSLHLPSSHSVTLALCHSHVMSHICLFSSSSVIMTTILCTACLTMSHVLVSPFLVVLFV